MERDRLLAALHPPAPHEEELVRPRRIPLPTLGEVLYEPTTGEPKRCGNCYKFVTSGACVEVRGEVGGGQVCGLHVSGTPQPYMPAVGRPARQLDPEDVGLIETPDWEGTACGSCRFFTLDDPEAELGLCEAVGAESTGLPPVSVQALGCCARWQQQRADVEIEFKIVPHGEPPHPEALDIE